MSLDEMSKVLRVCVLDYDDTIMMTRECKTQALIELGKRYFNKNIDPLDIEQHWGIAHQKLFEKLYSVSGEELNNAMALYQQLDDEFPIQAYPDAERALTRIQKNYVLIIVSSCTRQLIEAQLSGSAISSINFDYIFGAEDTEFHKPSGQVFNGLFETYKSELSDAEMNTSFVYIGDGHKDMLAAADAGIKFYGLDRSEKETQIMRQHQAEIHQSLESIADALTSFASKP